MNPVGGNMGEITQKRVGELQRGVFQILMNSADPMPAGVVIQQMKLVLPPTAYELGEYKNGISRFDKIIRFGTIASVKAGWLVKSKSGWFLTDEGKAAFNTFTTPDSLFKEAKRIYKEWDKSRVAQSSPSDLEAETDVDQAIENSDAQITFDAADEASWLTIEDYVSNMNEFDVQNQLVVGLLKGMGFFVEWFAPPGPDGGLDVVALTDPLGVSGARIKVSVKRRGAKANVKDLREFTSLLHPGDSGIYFSVAGFTPEAMKEVRARERRLRLLDLEQFVELWISCYERIPEEHRRYLQLRPIHFLVKPTK